MRADDAKDRPCEAEFEHMISTAQDRMHQVMRADHAPRRRTTPGRNTLAGGLVALALASGGAAVSQVGTFSSTESGEHSEVKGPVGINGQPAFSRDENAVTTTPWPGTGSD